MKKIQLTQGKHALVDDEDFEFLSQWKWHLSHGYAQRSINVSRFGNGKKTKTIRMHRTIMQLSERTSIDHINGDGLDNRKSNLRACTGKQNQQNRKTHYNKRFKGVNWHRRVSKWQTSIRVDGKLRHLGYFIDEIEAAKMYNKAALQYFGEYARLNEVTQ